MQFRYRIILSLCLSLVAAPVMAQGMGFGLGVSDVVVQAGGGAAALDGLATPTGAYSFRKLRSAYTGSSSRIRRTSDNVELDIGFTGNNFNTAAAVAHCGLAAGACAVRTWYDQSGFARDMVNTTAAQQPLLVFNCLGTLPCMYSNNALVSLTGPSVTPATGVVSLSAVSMRGIATGVCNSIRQNGVNRIAYLTASNEIQVAATGVINTPVATGGWNATSGVINGAASRIVNNGAAAVTGSITGSVTASGHSIVVNVSIPCSFAEAIIWDNYPLTPAEQTTLDTNQRNYWLQSPLDSFATPSGAYSFRKLKSTYTGAALRVRRVSDNAETDIGFLGFTGFTGAPFDTAAAVAHCGLTPGACVVHTWYDQSGSARHMTNTGNWPVLVFNCVGTLPCMYSNNVLVTLSGPSVTPATGVVSLSTVSMRAIATGSCNPIRQNGINRITYAVASNDIQLTGGGSLNASVATGAWNATSGVINGAASRIVNNGAAAVTGTLTGSVAAGAVSSLGSAGVPCSWSEAVIWDNYVLTPAEQAALIANQRSFWGF